MSRAGLAGNRNYLLLDSVVNRALLLASTEPRNWVESADSIVTQYLDSSPKRKMRHIREAAYTGREDQLFQEDQMSSLETQNSQ